MSPRRRADMATQSAPPKTYLKPSRVPPELL